MKAVYKNSIKVACLFFLSIFSGCLKDKGNYEYTWGNPVIIRYPIYTIPALIGEEVTLSPTRQYERSDLNASHYDHEWYVDSELVSRDTIFSFTGTVPGSFPLRYYMIDRETGVRFSASNATINVSSPFQTGWAILYEQSGKSEIAHIRLGTEGYVNYTGLYKSNNNDQELGSGPKRIKDYTVNGGRATAIIQTGGQGLVELDSYSYQKRLVASEAFVGGAPAGLAPINMAHYATSGILLNADGTVYPKFWTGNPIAYTVPWLGIPMQVPKGMKIRELWDTWSNATTYAFMYDELNNRILYIRLDAPNTTGGVAVIDTLPTPGTANPYPDDFVNPNQMGAWKYVWGGTFKDMMYNGDGAILMQSPSGPEMYLQRFGFQMVNRVPNLRPLSRHLFTGSSLVDANSKYVAVKQRNYLFFSGGADNRSLYYYDIENGTASRLYAQLDSRITALRQSDNSLELAVGLADGTVVLFDISDPVLISGAARELHRLTGLGTVVDITAKNGQMR